MASITQISSSTDLSALTGTKVGGTTSTSDTSSTTASADKAQALKDQFLQILLTQMQNQNPLDPMDTKEFTGQLTQFSSLEQQIDTNAKLDKLLGALNQNTLSAAFSYLGQYVDLDTETTTIQDGSAHWTYALPEDAESVTVKITDANGKTVYESPLQNGNGGSEIAKGVYALDISAADLTGSFTDDAVLKMVVTAKNSSDKAISADIHTTVKVESVQSDEENTYLQAGGILFEITDIKKIVDAPSSGSTA